MNAKLKKAITKFIEPQIEEFHQKRLDKLLELRLKDVLKRKNPYLFKAKNVLTAQDLVKTILDAYLSSQEEAVFGGVLEKLAIFVCRCVYGGNKSTTEGIDLELKKDGSKYIVSIKSGPNWGNSQQIERMKDNFKQAKRIAGADIIAVNGCCYGIDNKSNKGDYQKLCGQMFWGFISGDENLYIDIVEPLGYKAKNKNEDFTKEYAKVINKFTREFGSEYCDNSGNILWEKLVAFNSAKSN
ncbi:MAG: cytosolic protein [Candidatus Firestonebacteria bacterium RIFOXYC2_FULL_39_67]|nr:MAG: cytosolic protein [Candidatus Firestonebacteria bacterium RIFOXYD2_FULL_39_29]OGF56632.1 MAG: cytosolic protein [Candidatus Firestonebacteria bacterium RIFOXYC2_FULL_39_67]OGF57108.1 MAG: cytosolic protein [Candidatus Firestonebacteria bacterium RifOxyC12_full_39_7]